MIPLCSKCGSSEYLLDADGGDLSSGWLDCAKCGAEVRAVSPPGLPAAQYGRGDVPDEPTTAFVGLVRLEGVWRPETVGRTPGECFRALAKYPGSEGTLALPVMNEEEQDSADAWTLTFEAKDADCWPVGARMRRLLKHALRTLGLRCTSIGSERLVFVEKPKAVKTTLPVAETITEEGQT